jgi:hypothetical protein
MRASENVGRSEAKRDWKKVDKSEGKLRVQGGELISMAEEGRGKGAEEVDTCIVGWKMLDRGGRSWRGRWEESTRYCFREKSCV